MRKLNDVWKEWQRSEASYKDDVDFRSVWCYLAGYFGKKEIGKDGEKTLREMLKMKVET